jgi:hypothetical protein
VSSDTGCHKVGPPLVSIIVWTCYAKSKYQIQRSWSMIGHNFKYLVCPLYVPCQVNRQFVQNQCMQSKLENFSEVSCWFRFQSGGTERKASAGRPEAIEEHGGGVRTFSLRGATIWSRHAALPPLCSAGLSCPHSHSRRRGPRCLVATHSCPCCHIAQVYRV